MDAGAAKYLEENVGNVLAQALSEMAVVQPKDGVDFLSKWLAQYAEIQEAKSVKEQVEQDLGKMRAQTREKLAEKEAKREKERVASQALENMYSSLFEKFSSEETVFEDKFWQELVQVAQSAAGASAVYLGVQEPGEEGGEISGPHISYEYASKGSEWMTEKVLLEGKGVTWGALTENPAEESFQEMCLWKPPSVEPVVEVEEGAEPPEKPTIPYYPVSVECVTDVASMHYFDMTRLGAFLAIPLVYQSYYNGDAYADAKSYEEEKKAEALRRAEEEAARQAALEAGDPEPEAVEAPEEKVLTMRGTDVKMVLCLDTLGTNTAFEEAHAMKILELAKACSQCKSRTEFKQVDAQVLSVIDDVRRKEEEDQVAQVADSVEQGLMEQMEQAQAEAEDELRKELIQKKCAFLKALQVAKEMHLLIGSMTSWVYTTSDVMNVVAALCYFAGHTKAEVYPRRKSTMDWQKLKMLLNQPLSLLEKIVQKEVEGPRKGLLPEHLHAYILQQASPAEMDAEKAKEISPAFQLIYNLVQAGCAYRTADLELRKAEFNKKKEELEEGQEYEGPPLEELDDDFKEPA